MTRPRPPRSPRRQANVRAAVALGVIGGLSAIAGNLPGPPPSIPAPALIPAAPAPAASPGPGAAATPAPPPMLVPVVGGQPVDWWFAYKFSAASFPLQSPLGAGDCAFGGMPRRDFARSGQRYAYASSANPVLADGPGLIGTGPGDPLGATFARIWSGHAYYVVWNDQFYNDPERTGAHCDEKQCGSPWGHSKGVLAWDHDGNGVLLQVTTPSWPGAASAAAPRAAGNTLGCVADDNMTANAQDFFALRVTRADLPLLLTALATASVSTDVNNPQVVRRVVDGQPLPPDLDRQVAALGQVSGTRQWLDKKLSSGVRVIVKPSALHVPPWQFVSSRLGGENLVTATWWANPRIPPSRGAADVHCWDQELTQPPGRVDIALTSSWGKAKLAFTGGPNHAKIGVSANGGHGYAIFGDLNQQGTLGSPDKPDCASSQNGRGGLFFVVDNPQLRDGVARLLTANGTLADYGATH